MTNQMEVGQKVTCNGFPGTITEVCQGQLAGMVVVRLERGTVCVDALDVKPLINHVERIETYQLMAGNGRPIRKATKAIFADGFEVKFTEHIPSKTDAINQAIALRRRA